MTAKEVYDILCEFIENDFKHLRKKVDWIFIFMLMAAAGTIGTLIASILFIIRQ